MSQIGVTVSIENSLTGEIWWEGKDIKVVDTFLKKSDKY